MELNIIKFLIAITLSRILYDTSELALDRKLNKMFNDSSNTHEFEFLITYHITGQENDSKGVD